MASIRANVQFRSLFHKAPRLQWLAGTGISRDDMAKGTLGEN